MKNKIHIISGDNYSEKINKKSFYDNKIVKFFLYATIFWGLLGIIAGLLISILLYIPEIPEFLFGNNLKFSKGIIGYGRIRMIHTTTAIFAFIGNLIFTGSYYCIQRLLKTRIYSKILSLINFWGWQIFILLSWITFLLGFNTSKEYSEHEWPLDIFLGVIWFIYGINIILTILKRRVTHLYVSIWFFLSTWVSVLLLHLLNNIEYPISFFSLKSYSIYSGVQDALMQWWYGHNAVAFVLTTPILGLMYYFVPKACNNPIYSYKLSVIHFWSLIFIYIWAGPHHLMYTSLPNWTQVLGTIFSIMLIAPSWGGMLNGLLTLRNSWKEYKKDPILKFFIVSLLCYGLTTFDGPMLATKTINSIGHFTDWIIAHVHLGTLGWNGFMAFGIIYWLTKKLWNTKLYSEKLASFHFYIGFIGIIIYVIPMYCSSIIQSNMWKQFSEDGTLAHKNFINTVFSIIPFYIIRSIGGFLYLIGFILMIYNVYKTIKNGKFLDNEEFIVPILLHKKNNKKNKFHDWLERKPFQLTILSFLLIFIGSAIEIIPTFIIKSNISNILNVKPYTALELEGRDIYIREGCNSCHSQMIRPFRDEVVRYGDYSKAGEFIYDHPFLWGSKRTGPDLAREGGKKSDSWHFKHILNPRSVSKGSIMPSYPWIINQKLNISNIYKKMKIMKKLGVPYSKKEIKNSTKDIYVQSSKIVKNIYNESESIKKMIEIDKKNFKSPSLEKREIIALIAYLQKLGRDIKDIK